LAGEAAADEVNIANEAALVCPAIRSPYVVVPGHVGPVSCEYLSAVLVDFDLADAVVSGALKPEVETPDASEQAHESHRPDDAKLVRQWACRRELLDKRRNGLPVIPAYAMALM
jgi:hypothetical protein